MSMQQHSRLADPVSSQRDPTARSPRPFRRRALWWKLAFAIPLSMMLSGAGVIIWATVQGSRSVVLWNVCTGLLVVGFAVGVTCLGAWVASGGTQAIGPVMKPRQSDVVAASLMSLGIVSLLAIVAKVMFFF